MRIAWSDEEKTKLAKLWDDGVQTTKIAEEFGVTKNSILGKVHRLGLPRRREPAERRLTDKRIVIRKSKVAIPGVVVPESKTLQPSEGVDLMGLMYHHCREIIGRDEINKQPLYCGAIKQDGSSYCLRHHSINYQPPRVR